MEKSNFPVCTKIAIIGGGASGVALLKKLIDSLIDNMDSKIEISIFEKNDSLGPGLAYQDDVLTSLINRDAKLMSIDSDNPRDFIEWVSNILHLNEEIKTTFLPRALFGMYLQESLRGIVQIAKRKGIKLHISKNEIIEITKIKQQYMLKTRDREFMIFDQVAICIGNTLSQDPFQLRGQNHYIQNPYPLREKLENIPTNS
ncbi:FAD/NAD(P)-binding protein [Thermoactinomyces sp. DSM 45892]|uniref:FAD/NAD(P)-binding protein n=1 Tax=Thermoactinomyces sp. DSM 45892 TaxID=1882753 RepID=UPI00089C9B5A|nr:FAD/NAD(P)-binding protein [Thermoactinomyces sp. DSM 45892]SDZ34951.1 FAD-NAD(P)-binding [Thermoactinomyces sp. DSM 45892]